MESKTRYADEIFGGALEVKRIFVNELKERREKAGLSAGELTRLLGLSTDWPSVQEIEENPALFTFRFQQVLNLRSLDKERLFSLDGKEISDRIAVYIKQTDRLEQILAEFRASVRNIHVSFLPKDPEEIERYLEKILNGEKTPTASINSVPPEEYAACHIYSCVMQEIGDKTD